MFLCRSYNVERIVHVSKYLTTTSMCMALLDRFKTKQSACVSYEMQPWAYVAQSQSICEAEGRGNFAAVLLNNSVSTTSTSWII